MRSELTQKLQRLAEENLFDIEQAKESGRMAIGFYCLYSPIELAVAVDAIPLPLCGTRNEPISAAEEILPRNLCPLIKSSFGFAITDTCPYFRLSDIIIGDTTCDGKKKMFELLKQYKTTYVLQIPQCQDMVSSLPLWRSELERCKAIIERHSHIEITDERLSSAIHLLNRKRATRKALMDVTRRNPAPVSGSMLLEILHKVSFLSNIEKGISLMEEARTEILADSDSSAPYLQTGRKRILLTGVPVGLGSDKVVKLVEESNADVVAFENCSGYKQTFSVDESKSPLDALAESSLATPCSVMSPNPGRLALLDEMISGFAVDGVIDLTWLACHTYNIESFSVGKWIEQKFGMPTLHLETDYSESDTEQIRVRIEAYLEML